MISGDTFGHDNRIAALLGIALLIASYLLFSVRTLLDPVDPGDLLSVKRFMATAVGATMFWLIATRWQSLANPATSGRLWRGAVLLLAALGPVLATRIGYDLLVTGESESILARNVRWIIAWSGYFVAALLGYRLLVRGEADKLNSSKPAWTHDDYIAHLVGNGAEATRVPSENLPAGETNVIAYELRR